jgi:hypothetical protein
MLLGSTPSVVEYFGKLDSGIEATDSGQRRLGIGKRGFGAELASIRSFCSSRRRSCKNRT